MSKVRSLFLDAFDAEHVKVMLMLGNTKVNSIYEAAVPEDEHKVLPPRAFADSTRYEEPNLLKLLPMSIVLQCRSRCVVSSEVC